jgi:hypothetical protein
LTELSASAPRATAVLDAVSALPSLAEATLNGPATRLPGTDLESFSLKARVTTRSLTASPQATSPRGQAALAQLSLAGIDRDRALA